MEFGIEAIGYYFGAINAEVKPIYEHRQLDMKLLTGRDIRKRTLALAWEDPVTNAVNAAKEIINEMSAQQRASISTIITATESAIDFRKSIATSVIEFLDIPGGCRAFEIKQACYGGIAALQTAYGLVCANPDERVLVICTDIPRSAGACTYEEPTQGSGAVALIVSAYPKLARLNSFRPAFYSTNIYDTFRPGLIIETGDREKAYMNFLASYEKCMRQFCEKNNLEDIRNAFDYFIYPGIAKLPFNHIMKRWYHMCETDIEAEFSEKVEPSLWLWRDVGNLYSATVFTVLLGAIANAENREVRMGMFAYGSGSSAEFMDLTLSPNWNTHFSQQHLLSIYRSLDTVSHAEYLNIVEKYYTHGFGIENFVPERDYYYERYFEGKNHLILKRISSYKREYMFS